MRGVWMGMALALAVVPAWADDSAVRSFEMSYEVSATVPEGTDSVKLWIPVPQTTEYQTIENVRVEGVPHYRLKTEERFGNLFVIAEPTKGATDLAVTMTVDVHRQERRNLDGDAVAVAEALANREQYLTPSSMVTIDGPIAEEARRVAGDETNPLTVARRLYDNIVDTMVYDKSGVGWGRGDAVYACDTRAGNCTDFHSLFIGEARSLEVPARFLMGFSVPNDAAEGAIGGYHCWAEFFIEGRGWIPVDASEAFKDQTRREELFGGLDRDRVQFTIGRDLTLPEMQGAPLNYSIYPYAEADGEPMGGIEHAFRYRNLN